MAIHLLIACAGGAAIGLLVAGATACAMRAREWPITLRTVRADHHAREGLAAHLPSPVRDFASMRIAAVRYLGIPALARRARTDEEAADAGAVAAERIGLILGHVAIRVGTLAAGALMATVGGWWWLVAGVAAGYALDHAGHRAGVAAGRAAGAALALRARRRS